MPLPEVVVNEHPGQPDQEGSSTAGKNRELSWPTPNSSDQYNPNIPHDIGRHYLRTEVTDKKPNPKAKLNPRWCEQLMGVPIGWTKLKEEDHRIDELRLLGNGVVPQTAEKAFRVLWEKLNEIL